MTEREHFENMLVKRCMIDSADEIIEVVTDFLYDKTKRLKEEEPYAINTIHEYETAAHVIEFMLE